MKNFIISAIIATTFVSCGHEEPQPIKQDQLLGLWTLQQIHYPDGNVLSSPLAGVSVFAVYAESVRIEQNDAYVPVFWMSDSNNVTLTDDGGTYQFIPSTSQLLFRDGRWDLDFKISTLSDSELSLTYTGTMPMIPTGTQFNFKRQPWTPDFERLCPNQNASFHPERPFCVKNTHCDDGTNVDLS